MAIKPGRPKKKTAGKRKYRKPGGYDFTVLFIVLTLVLSLLAGCGSSNSEPASTELGQSENVVILVLDALSSQYLSQMGSNSNLAKMT